MKEQAPQKALLNKRMSPEEVALLSRILKGGKRPTGFRLYTNQASFANELKMRFAQTLETIRMEKGNPDFKFDRHEGFVLRERLKIDMWKELSAEERDNGRDEAAKEANREVETMTPFVAMFQALHKLIFTDSDEKTLLHHKHIVNHMHHIAESAGIYMVIYSSMSYAGQEWATV